MKSYYKCKYHFNAVYETVHEEEERAQSFRIVLYVEKKENSISMDINELDQFMDEYLERYRLRRLKEIELFQGKTDLETIGNCLFEDIKARLKDENFEIVQLDISDDMMDYYQVSTEIMLPIMNEENTKINFEMILDQKEYLKGATT